MRPRPYVAGPQHLERLVQQPSREPSALRLRPHAPASNREPAARPTRGSARCIGRTHAAAASPIGAAAIGLRPRGRAHLSSHIPLFSLQQGLSAELTHCPSRSATVDHGGGGRCSTPAPRTASSRPRRWPPRPKSQRTSRPITRPTHSGNGTSHFHFGCGAGEPAGQRQVRRPGVR